VRELTYQFIDALWLERVHGEGGPKEASRVEEKSCAALESVRSFGGPPRRYVIGRLACTSTAMPRALDRVHGDCERFTRVIIQSS
jgi:hypothetical protein